MWVVFLRSDKDFPPEGTFFFQARYTFKGVFFFVFLFFVFFKGVQKHGYKSLPECPPWGEIFWGWRRAQELFKEFGQLRELAGVHYRNLRIGGIT